MKHIEQELSELYNATVAPSIPGYINTSSILTDTLYLSSQSLNIHVGIGRQCNALVTSSCRVPK